MNLTQAELDRLAAMFRSMGAAMGFPQVGELLASVILAAPAVAKGHAAAQPFVRAAIHLAQNGGQPDAHRWAELLAGLQRNSATLQEIAARDASATPKEPQ